ncbi:hypothetical protein KFZ70_12605 [Tamlana fucoidanivorans]|uniref:mannan endo-1,4-beta-mannosidase n=1 Tax=Allotamlana fucoidanivorans TaxID=2583814 RepID=A0A5C4SLM4_9FLAO|nr:hypothetical protein [Tamlana fucoidanivorans]TNJ44889.1 hypothetical protein FGF67_06920 [Tamlana fucoidanivorans]
MHIWLQNWNWFSSNQGVDDYENMLKKVDDYWEVHVAAAEKLNKPIVLEEFGLARDSLKFNPKYSVDLRNKFYGHIFQKVLNSIKKNGRVLGLNFWSYSGEGIPNKPGFYWTKGDHITGDSPHEKQGWYSVYSTDISTLKIIETYSWIGRS